MQLLRSLLVSFLIVFQSSCGSSFFNKYGSAFNGTNHGKMKADNAYRLPGNARPTNYDVTLELGPKSNLVKGEVLITMDVDPSTTTTKTSSIELNSDIKFSEETKPTFAVNGDICSYTQSDTHMTIKCPKPFEGKSQLLKITYETNLANSDYQGIYKRVYTENNKDKFMISTQLKPAFARRVFPCFDEPKYKAPIKLTLKTNTKEMENSNWKSNMDGKTTIEGENTLTTFKISPKMSTYMLSFVFTQDFKSFTTTELKDEFEIYARPSAEKYVSTVLENGPKLISEMDKFTGIPFKTLGIQKMVLAAIPEFYERASENWGLITFREELVLDEAKTTTARDKQSIIEMVAHEVSSQWFGNYVTMEWWSELWLVEGFAQYFQYYLTDLVAPDMDSLKQFVVKGKQQALKLDARSDAKPLSANAANINTEKEISAQFGEISSLKGASVLQMLRYTLGQDVLKQGLKSYLITNQYSNPTSKDLIAALQTTVPKKLDLKLDTLFKEWIYNSGYPLLYVSVDSENKVTIKATKFSSSPDEATDEDKKATWWVPLSHTTSEKPNFEDISFDWKNTGALSEYSVSLSEKKDSWIIFNLQAVGFYRVNYDQELWNRIIATLNNPKTFTTINVLNRAQLLDDIFNIARHYKSEEEKGRLYYLTAFKLAEYLKHETEYYPWYTFFTEMQYLMEVIQDEETLRALRVKILDIVSPQLVIPKETHTDTLKQNLLVNWACKLGSKDCIKWAKDQFSSYKENALSIDNNYRDVIVCTGLATSNNMIVDYEKILNAIKESVLPYEKMDLIKGITCINEDVTMDSFLDETIKETTIKNAIFPRTYLDTVMSSLYTGGFRSLDHAITFVLKSVENIEKYWHGFVDPQTLIKQIGSKIYTVSHLNMINSYIEVFSKDETKTEITNAVKEAGAIAVKNIEYLKQYSNILTSVIMYNGEDPPPPTTSAPPGTTTKAGSNKIVCTLLLPILLALGLKYVL